MKKIVLLPGDGIGPELIEACVPLLELAAKYGGHTLVREVGDIGWSAYDRCGDVMPKATWNLCYRSDAVLFGAVGLPDRDHELPPLLRPEQRALLPLRQELKLGVNIRPIVVFPTLTDLSPLRPHLVEGGVSITFFRELIGGEYFGPRRKAADGTWAEDVCRYERPTIEAVARAAFAAGRAQGVSVTSVDKANVLCAAGTFWRDVVTEVHRMDFPDVSLEHMYVDACNLYLMTKPQRLHIVLTSNMFGDILSDAAAGLAGSMGLLPSASLNPVTGFGLYEPGGGSAPDIAGNGVANPIGMVLSIALMFRHSLDDARTAQAIEDAVRFTLEQGVRTPDLVRGKTGLREACVTTTGMVAAICNNLT